MKTMHYQNNCIKQFVKYETIANLTISRYALFLELITSDKTLAYN